MAIAMPAAWPAGGARRGWATRALDLPGPPASHVVTRGEEGGRRSDVDASGTIIDRAIAMARGRGGPAGRVVFPEWDDPRIGEATVALRRRGLLDPVPCAAASAAQLALLVDGRGIREGVAQRMLTRPLFRAAAMVAAGEAEAMVAGVATPARRVIEAASIVLGPAPGVQFASGCHVLLLPDGREMLWSDCSVTVAPDASQLADIARASARSAEALFGEARVALLSFSTGASGTGDTVDLVREVAKMMGFAGPIQAGAALDPLLAARQEAGDGPGVGDANVLVFPDLDAGAIALALVRQFCNVQVIGPMLQGFGHPVCDLPRTCGVEEIMAATVLTLARA